MFGTKVIQHEYNIAKELDNHSAGRHFWQIMPKKKKRFGSKTWRNIQVPVTGRYLNISPCLAAKSKISLQW